MVEEEKPKKPRAQKYRFIGGGVRVIGDQRIRHGDVVLLKKEQVTREYEKFNK